MENSLQSKKSSSIINIILFTAIYSTVLFVFVVPFSWSLVGLAAIMYVVRMFGITAGYHRYFSHRAFKTSRIMQFALAWIGGMAMQKGPIWWAAHHRNHHKFSDTEKDLHSPIQKGFWWSHILWFLVDDYNDFDKQKVKDLTKYPELVWIDKYYWIPPLVSALVLVYFGYDVLIWGYAVPNFFGGNGTWTINSLTHLYGKQRYDAGDMSRNHWFFAIITMGEGWHNNHHYYAHSANMGFYWYEIDLSYYILKLMSWTGLVWDLRKPPEHVIEEGLKNDALQNGKDKFKNLQGQWVLVTQKTAMQ